MRPALSVAALLLAGVLAGCADGADPPQGTIIDAADVAPYDKFIPETRPVLANVTLHEAPAEGSMDVQDIDGAETWEPRDVVLSYHGIAETYDEWGRLVPAHVFRYTPMRLVIDSIDIGPTGISASGHYEPVRVEYYFDAADGRFMGRADLDREVRNFASPEYRAPFAYGYEGTYFLFMMPYFLGGDLSKPVQIEAFDHTYNYTLEPYEGERPIEGVCDMFELHVDDGQEEPAEAVEEVDPREEHHTIACFDGFMPLWTWSGTEEDGAMRMERRSAPFNIPAPKGEVLARGSFETAPMDRIDPPLGLPLAPTYVPPSRASIDYAHKLHGLAEAMYLSPGYVEYALRHDELYLEHAVTGWPPHSLLFLPGGLGGIVDDAPINAEETAWMMTTEGVGMYWLNVHTATYGEADRLHYPDTQGGDFDIGGQEYPTREDLGDIVVADDVQARVPDIAPEQPGHLTYFVWPEFDDFDMGANQITWWAMENCFEYDDDAHFLAFSGVDGRLYGAGKMVSTESGCSASTFFLPTNGVEGIEVFPPTQDRPAMLLGPDGTMRPAGPWPGLSMPVDAAPTQADVDGGAAGETQVDAAGTGGTVLAG